MTTVNNLLAGVNFDQLADQTIIQAGGGRELLPEGRALVRPFMYIECGNHSEMYKGKAKPVAPYFRLGFKIVGGSGKNVDGKLEKFVLNEGSYPQLVPYFKQQLAFTEKAKTPKWLAALNRVGESKTHLALKVAESALYYLDIGIETKDDGKKYNTYDFSLLQPAVKIDEDEETGELTERAVKAPQLKPEDMMIFLWEHPTKEQWDSIFIEGQYEAQKDDKGNITKPAASKNRYQEECLKAVNFEGSALHNLLSSLEGGFKMPDLSSEETTGVPEVPVTPSEPDVPDVPSIPE